MPQAHAAPGAGAAHNTDEANAVAANTPLTTKLLVILALLSAVAPLSIDLYLPGGLVEGSRDAGDVLAVAPTSNDLAGALRHFSTE